MRVIAAAEHNWNYVVFEHHEKLFRYVVNTVAVFKRQVKFVLRTQVLLAITVPPVTIDRGTRLAAFSENVNLRMRLHLSDVRIALAVSIAMTDHSNSELLFPS
jgi:uncharacterized membrane protein